MFHFLILFSHVVCISTSRYGINNCMCMYFHCYVIAIMDRNWMHARRNSDEFEKGLEEFIAFAREHAEDADHILCPCVDCNNMVRLNIVVVKVHLMAKGINQLYKCWLHHGEILGDFPSNVDDMIGCDTGVEVEFDGESSYEDEFEDDEFEEMLKAMRESIVDCLEMLESLCSDAKKPLYPGCTKYSRLSVVPKLFNVKANNGIQGRSK